MDKTYPSLKPHEIAWTPKKVEFFWDWFASSEVRRKHYFGEKLAEAVVKVLRKNCPPPARVLDFGCGTGTMLQALANAGYSVCGCDTSEFSVLTAKQKLTGHRNFEDCVVLNPNQLPFSERSFDIVIATETIEHLLPEWIDSAFSVWYQMLRSDGVLFLTTPNKEQLEANMVCCPDCGCEFHRMQHIQSFDSASLSNLALQNGFLTVQSQAVSLQFINWGLFIRTLRWFHNAVRSSQGFEVFEPNLIWFGQKETRNV